MHAAAAYILRDIFLFHRASSVKRSRWHTTAPARQIRVENVAKLKVSEVTLWYGDLVQRLNVLL